MWHYQLWRLSRVRQCPCAVANGQCHKMSKSFDGIYDMVTIKRRLPMHCTCGLLWKLRIHLHPGDVAAILSILFKLMTKYGILGTSSLIAFKWIPQKIINERSIFSGDGLVSSGNNPLLDQMLTQICVPFFINNLADIANSKHWDGFQIA